MCGVVQIHCATPPSSPHMFNLTLQAPTSVCAASLQPCEAASRRLFGRAGEIARSITRARFRHVRTGGDTAPVITSDRPLHSHYSHPLRVIRTCSLESLFLICLSLAR